MGCGRRWRRRGRSASPRSGRKREAPPAGARRAVSRTFRRASESFRAA
jgi:hypothetical protein